MLPDPSTAAWLYVTTSSGQLLAVNASSGGATVLIADPLLALYGMAAAPNTGTSGQPLVLYVASDSCIRRLQGSCCRSGALLARLPPLGCMLTGSSRV